MKLSAPPEMWRRAFAPLFFAAALIFAFAAESRAQTGSASADRQLKMWRSFAPPDGRFVVSLPAQPTGGAAPSENPNLRPFVYESQNAGSTFGVGYVDFPVAPFDAEDTDLLFSNIRDGIFKKTTMILLGETKTRFKNYPAREISFKEGTNITKLQIILVGKRLYEVYCTTPVLQNLPESIVKVYQAESDKFFNSFEIVDNKPQTVRSEKGKAK